MALEELSGLGIGFISYQDNIDLSTPQGRLMFHIIASMAEFERELIRERVKAGLENACRKGKSLGRRPVPPIDRAKAVAHPERDPSLSVRKIAKKTGWSSGFVGRVLKEHQTSFTDVLP